MKWPFRRLILACFGAALLQATAGAVSGDLDRGRGEGMAMPAAPGSTHLGYGVNSVGAGDRGPAEMGFDWTKDFYFPGEHPPYRTLVRVDANYRDLADRRAYGRGLEALVLERGRFVEAVEIGNEPNLDANYGWGTSPNAADYTALLCEAYAAIKRADPRIIVVSAGLSAAGRIPFTYDGHKGYCKRGHSWCTIDYQDEREYLREMLRAGAGRCMDAFGYHPYGFSAPHNAAPGSAACGPNDFCFRGVEPLKAILWEEFGVRKPVWATEFGWILDPASVGRPECRNHPSMSGREWQFVTPDQQAQYLRGAYEFAQAHYPWMGPMFLFSYGRYNEYSCEQMGFYDIRDRPAETALASMRKRYVMSNYRWSAAPTFLLETDQPRPQSASMSFSAFSQEPMTWLAELTSANHPISIEPSAGPEDQPLRISVEPSSRAAGHYKAELKLTATSPVAAPVIRDAVQAVTVWVTVTDAPVKRFLPAVVRRSD